MKIFNVCSNFTTLIKKSQPARFNVGKLCLCYLSGISRGICNISTIISIWNQVSALRRPKHSEKGEGLTSKTRLAAEL